MSTSRRQFLAGLRAELPILAGVIPFGMIYGLLALAAGLTPVQAQAMSAIVFAGSSQFITVQLVAAGAPALVIVLTGGVVNLRHALYSASVAPYLKPLNRLWKYLLGYLLTDEAYAVAITHYYANLDPRGLPTEGRESDPHSTNLDPRGLPTEGLNPGPLSSSDVGAASVARAEHWYFLGAGLALWTTWQLSTAVGVFLGAVIPESWPLDFALPLTFIALLIPSLRDRAALVAAFVAGIVAVLAVGMPLNLGLVAAAVIGIAAGLWMESLA